MYNASQRSKSKRPTNEGIPGGLQIRQQPGNRERSAPTTLRFLAAINSYRLVEAQLPTLVRNLRSWGSFAGITSARNRKVNCARAPNGWPSPSRAES